MSARLQQRSTASRTASFIALLNTRMSPPYDRGPGLRFPRGAFFSAATLLVLAACSTPGKDACDGIVGPSRSVTASPSVLTLDVGLQGRVSLNVSSNCNADDVAAQWLSVDSTIARVDASGQVIAVGVGTTTVIAAAFADQARANVAVTVRPRVPTRLDARPDADTLQISATRTLSDFV